jgi:hypothetical protein
MAEADFSKVIASAQERARDREANKEELTGPPLEAIKSKQEVLHTVVNRTLHHAWRSLEAAGVKAVVDTDTDARGDWRMSLQILSGRHSKTLVFTVQAALGAPMVYSKESRDARQEVDYSLIHDATPVEIARIVAEYISETLG